MDALGWDIPVVAAVFIHASEGVRTVGAAILAPRDRSSEDDVKTRSLTLFQFIDEAQHVWLARLLHSSQVQTCYVADALPEGEWNRLVASLCEEEDDEPLSVERAPRGKFNEADAEPALVKLSGGAVLGLDSVPVALKAAAFLVEKGRLTAAAAAAEAAAADNDDGGGEGEGGGGLRAAQPGRAGSYSVCLGRLDEFMRLDGGAVKALNLLPSRRDATPVPTAAAASARGSAPSSSSGGSSITSVYGLLSFHARTAVGRRLLKAWLLQPLTVVGSIATRQDGVQAFVESPGLRSAWRGRVALEDTAALASRLQRAKAGLGDLVKLRQTLQVVPAVAALVQGALGGEGGTKEGEAGGDGLGGALPAPCVEVLGRYAEYLLRLQGAFGAFTQAYEDSVDDADPRRPRLRPSVDPALRGLAGAVKDAKEAIAELHASCKDSWPLEVGGDLRCEYDRAKGGYVFRVKKAAEKALRGLPAVEIVSVLKDGIYFTTRGSSGLTALGRDLADAEAAYAERSKELLGPLLEAACGCVPPLELACLLLGELDAYYAMAQVAACASGTWVRPVIVGPSVGGQADDGEGGGGGGGGQAEGGGDDGIGDIEVIGGRHPVIEMQEGSGTFIPNDYVLRRDKGRFQIITGPNAGGKSVYIRTLGVLVVLAQMGCYVPAESARLPVFDCVAARIGAGDKSVKGVSTFMAEMLEASAILAGTTQRSLVIIDELGRGTSTYDGFGLAWAISEHIVHTTRCFAVFATHFHELTALPAATSLAANRHVAVHCGPNGSLTMLYAVKEGPCPSSFGIQAAASTDFPPSVVAMARCKAAQLEALGGGASSIMLASTAAGAEAGDASSSSSGGSSSSLAGSPAPDASAVARSRRFLEALAAQGPAFEALPPPAKKARMRELLQATER